MQKKKKASKKVENNACDTSIKDNSKYWTRETQVALKIHTGMKGQKQETSGTINESNQQRKLQTGYKLNRKQEQYRNTK